MKDPKTHHLNRRHFYDEIQLLLFSIFPCWKVWDHRKSGHWQISALFRFQIHAKNDANLVKGIYSKWFTASFRKYLQEQITGLENVSTRNFQIWFAFRLKTFLVITKVEFAIWLFYQDTRQITWLIYWKNFSGLIYYLIDDLPWYSSWSFVEEHAIAVYLPATINGKTSSARKVFILF